MKAIYGVLFLSTLILAEEILSQEEAESLEIKKIASSDEIEELPQDEAQERFVDLSVDVSYGLPQLGYVYNGLHLRGPRKAKPQNRQTFKSNFDFDSDFEEIKDTFKNRPNNEIQVVVEETAPQFNEIQTTSNPEKFNFPPYVPPSALGSSSAPNPSPVSSSTKPPLHIKIQKDLQGLVGSMTNMFKGQSKTGLPGLPKLPPLPTLPQALKVKEGGSRPFALNLPTFPQGGLKVPTLPQAPGKPPLMQKIREDFFSWLPTTSSGSSYKAPEPSYNAPEPNYHAPEQSYHTPEPNYHAPETNYHTPEPVYTTPTPKYEEPLYYHPSGYSSPKKEVREPMLSKFVKDIGKVNKWLARQTVEIVNEGQNFELPKFDLPQIPQIQKRKDSVMKYIAAPDLSQAQ